MPKISIVTPAYNCEKYLEEAVNSVLAQSFEDWELLIIDDCSKDATWLRMQTLAKKDNRIRIFQNQHNSGSDPQRADERISDAGRRRNSRGFCYMACNSFQNPMRIWGR